MNLFVSLSLQVSWYPISYLLQNFAILSLYALSLFDMQICALLCSARLQWRHQSCLVIWIFFFPSCTVDDANDAKAHWSSYIYKSHWAAAAAWVLLRASHRMASVSFLSFPPFHFLPSRSFLRSGNADVNGRAGLVRPFSTYNKHTPWW